MVNSPEEHSSFELKNLSEDERVERNTLLVSPDVGSFGAMTFDQVFERCKKVFFGMKGLAVRALYEKGLAEGKSTEEIRARIQELGISDRTMRRELPQEAKQFQRPSPKGGHLATPSHRDDRYQRTEIGQTAKLEGSRIPLQKGMGIVEPEREGEPESRSLRMVMSAKKFKALFEHMDDFHTKNGAETDYAIEYDPDDKELYVDLAEKNEKRNITD